MAIAEMCVSRTPRTGPGTEAAMGDGTAMADLVARFARSMRIVANSLARRLPPCPLDADDLVSAGVIGLMDAVGKFDPGRGIRFDTYAHIRIRGAMLDEIRAMEWAPRHVREKAARLAIAYKDLERTDRAATEEEVAAALGVDLRRLDGMRRQTSRATMMSLEAMAEADLNVIERVPAHGADALAVLVGREARHVLGEAVGRLPARERAVVVLYYYEDLRMVEIGRVLGVSVGRVSQLHRTAIGRLKADGCRAA